MLIFIFPIIFHFRLFGWRGRSGTELFCCAVILLVGMIGGVIGGSSAVYNLWEDFQGNGGPGPSI